MDNNKQHSTTLSIALFFWQKLDQSGEKNDFDATDS